MIITVAVLLLSAFPSFYTSLFYVRFRDHMMETYAIIVVVFALLDALVLHPGIFAPVEVTALVAGVGAGLAYYAVEIVRLRLPLAGTLFAPVSSGPLILPLVAVAVAEEIVFRWYLLFAPAASGIAPVALCVVLSSCAFALAHLRSGLETVASRFAFGAVLGIATAAAPRFFWGAIAAHVLYNLAVGLKPMVVLRPQL